jgi:hypothetical protein
VDVRLAASPKVIDAVLEFKVAIFDDFHALASACTLNETINYTQNRMRRAPPLLPLNLTKPILWVTAKE